jgi:hypothetical protein
MLHPGRLAINQSINPLDSIDRILKPLDWTAVAGSSAPNAQNSIPEKILIKRTNEIIKLANVRGQY